MFTGSRPNSSKDVGLFSDIHARTLNIGPNCFTNHRTTFYALTLHTLGLQVDVVIKKILWLCKVLYVGYKKKNRTRLTDTRASFLYKTTCTSLWYKFLERVHVAGMMRQVKADVPWWLCRSRCCTVVSRCRRLTSSRLEHCDLAVDQLACSSHTDSTVSLTDPFLYTKNTQQKRQSINQKIFQVAK